MCMEQVPSSNHSFQKMRLRGGVGYYAISPCACCECEDTRNQFPLYSRFQATFQMKLYLLVVTLAILASASWSQITGIPCASDTYDITLQDVEFDPSLYSGLWYTLSTCYNCTDVGKSLCAQVVLGQPDPSSFNLTYTGSFVTTGDATDPPEQAYGNLTFLEENADTWNPAYRLHLDLGIPVLFETSNYWILAAEKDSSGQIGLIITYSCGLFPGTDANAQIFFLSRYPYYYDTITYNSAVEKAKLGKKQNELLIK